MGIETLLAIVPSLGTIVAACALVLTYRQVRRLEQSIKGNTYQMLTDQALELLKLSLQYPDLKYLDLGKFAPDEQTRRQEVYERIWANYIDNVWGQMRQGLMTRELAATYLSLFEKIFEHHPGIAQQMAATNFTKSLRDHIARVTRSAGPDVRASQSVTTKPAAVEDDTKRTRVPAGVLSDR